MRAGVWPGPRDLGSRSVAPARKGSDVVPLFVSDEQIAAGSDDVQVVDPARDGAWDNLVATHPQASVFHSSAWAKVLMNTYGHQPFYLSVTRDGRPMALLPLMEVASRLTGRRAVSLPFSDFAGPLFFESDLSLQPLTAPLANLARARRWKYVELRTEAGAETPSFFNHTLDLTVGPERLLENVASTVRRNLRKAARSGVTVTIGQKRSQLVEYYRLHVRTRRRHGLPPQSFTFFANLHQQLLQRDGGFIVLAFHGTRPIAGAVFLLAGPKAVFKFGASDERFQQFRANNLVMWEAIKFLSERGAAMLHFGRTSPENEGLRRFKLGWGATEGAMAYSRLHPSTTQWTVVSSSSAGMHQHVFRKLPLVANRLLGSVCYPHLD